MWPVRGNGPATMHLACGRPMPVFSVSRTVDLDPDLTWMLKLEPTHDNFNWQGRFLRARLPRASDAPPGIAYHFTITNIFAGMRHAGSEYDYVMGGRLADARDFDLCYRPLPDPDAWPAEARMASAESRELVHAVCNDFAVAWGVGLLCYDHPGIYDHVGGIPDEPAVPRPLYFEPHISLPDRTLIHRLRDELDTWGLMLLTARHELGYLWLKAKQWCQDHTRPWLDEWDWGLITVRQRAQSLWVPGKVYAVAGNVEAPTVRPWYPSDLAGLYASLGEVAATVYARALGVRQCKKILPDGSQCLDPVPPRRGSGPTNGGRGFSYCEKHTTSRSRPQSTRE
jgi:hypothetical protein